MTESRSRNPFTDKRWMSSLALGTLLMTRMPLMAASDTAEVERVTASGDVLKELLNGPNGIPISLLNKASCVIVLPSVKKVGFLVAASLWPWSDELPPGP